MTTEGMPERIWIDRHGRKFSGNFDRNGRPNGAVYYTRTSWLIERLEGMKVVEDDMNQWRTGHNKAIDAVIALVREG